MALGNIKWGAGGGLSGCPRRCTCSAFHILYLSFLASAELSLVPSLVRFTYAQSLCQA